MHRRIIALLLMVVCVMLPIPAFAVNGFSSNPDAIEQAAKSVLMLQVFDANDEEIATGSGFVAFNNRTIITNHHVIEGADWMLANSDDGYQYMVTKVLVADEEKDIAICEFMSPTDLQPLEFNVNGELKRAESIVAIGSPIGITNTVSLGNISALYKEGNVSWIQFTAPISHGSSGGALFDNEGKVIGVTSASYIDTQNLNLAVHISEVEDLYNNWDGVKPSFGEFMAIANATPTPAPTATPAPTPEPTATPTLRPTATPAPTPTPMTELYSELREGDRGEDVKRLQAKLIELGYLKGTADGIWGKKTSEAVENFCKKNKEEIRKLDMRYSAATAYHVASHSMQELLYHGNPSIFQDILNVEVNYAEWEFLDGNKLKIRFNITNLSSSKTIQSYDFLVRTYYGTDYPESTERYDNTLTRIQPWESIYTDYVIIPNANQITRLFFLTDIMTYEDRSWGEHEYYRYDSGLFTIKGSDMNALNIQSNQHKK